jgi:transposase-like protein
MTDWPKIKQAYEGVGAAELSTREIARQHGIAESTIRKRAKIEKWARPARATAAAAHEAATTDPQQTRRAAPIIVSVIDIATAGFEPADLIERGRKILLGLMAELETEAANLDLLRELIETETVRDTTPHRRRILEKVLSLPTRAQAAKNLASALAVLRGIGPGKKDQARLAADRAVEDSPWGSDLDFKAKRPKPN